VPYFTIDDDKSLILLYFVRQYATIFDMATTWKLRDYLHDRRIRPAKLANLLEGRMSRTSIYTLVAEVPPKAIYLETLDAILPALRELTGEDVQVSDLLEYESSERVSASGRPYTGDPETDALLDDVELIERIERFERGEVKLIPWSQVKAVENKRRGL